MVVGIRLRTFILVDFTMWESHTLGHPLFISFGEIFL